MLSISLSFVSSACFSVFPPMNYENNMKNSHSSEVVLTIEKYDYYY